MSGTERDGERHEREYRTSLGRPFIDKMLLAIIDAHPEPQIWSAASKSGHVDIYYPDSDVSQSEVRRLESREERLRFACNALFGVTVIGRPNQQDQEALRWMAAEMAKDQRLVKEIGRTPRSVRDLSIRATKIFFPHAPNSASRLRNNFAKTERYLIGHKTDEHHEREDIEFAALREIAGILSQFWVDTCLDERERQALYPVLKSDAEASQNTTSSAGRASKPVASASKKKGV